MYRLILFIFVVILFINSAIATEIRVGNGENSTTIKSALLIARNGDKIVLKSGYYAEGEIIVDKEVEISGENYPVIDGEGKSQIFTVKVNNVTLRGLIIKNTGLSYVKDIAAIKAMNIKNLTVDNCKLIKNFFGIYLSKCTNCHIKNNSIEASDLSESSSANGIHQWYCDGIDIQNNYIHGHRDGIYLEFSRNAFMRNNISENNLRYGLHFMFSDSCTYQDNIFRHNGSGVAVMYTKRITMIHNRFEKNWGSAAYGMLLKEISDSRIQDNIFTENTVAVFAESCNRITVTHNEFSRNGWAIKVFASSTGNSFTANNFFGNSFNVSTNSTHNTNTFTGNYWSEYNGYDLNRDGIGDIPFRPVRLFSLLIEKHPPALILLRSVFVDVMDVAERIMPSLTPETLVDHQPKMKPIK